MVMNSRELTFQCHIAYPHIYISYWHTLLVATTPNSARILLKPCTQTVNRMVNVTKELDAVGAGWLVK